MLTIMHSAVLALVNSLVLKNRRQLIQFRMNHGNDRIDPVYIPFGHSILRK